MQNCSVGRQCWKHLRSSNTEAQTSASSTTWIISSRTAMIGGDSRQSRRVTCHWCVLYRHRQTDGTPRGAEIQSEPSLQSVYDRKFRLDIGRSLYELMSSEFRAGFFSLGRTTVTLKCAFTVHEMMRFKSLPASQKVSATDVSPCTLEWGQDSNALMELWWWPANNFFSCYFVKYGTDNWQQDLSVIVGGTLARLCCAVCIGGGQTDVW